MHDVIGFLKDAVLRGQGAGMAGCYIVRDGAIYAYRDGLQAGVPWPDASRFTVAADAVDTALSRMKEVDSIEIEEDAVVLRCGRIRSTIRRIHEEPPAMPELPPDEDWTRCPAGLAKALEIAKGFTGDRVWQVGVRMSPGAVTAFGPVAGVMVDVSGLDVPGPFLMPKETAAYLAAQGDPDEVAYQGNAACFRWEDGRWVRAQSIANEMPEDIIRRIFDTAGDEARIEVTDEWRSALADAAALSDDTVQLTASGLIAVKENLRSDVDLDVDLGADHTSRWKAKRLGEVLAVAERWNPEAWPQPALFLAAGLKGVIAGLK